MKNHRADKRQAGLARLARRLRWLGWTIALLLLATCWPALGANLLDRVNQQEITQVVRLKAGHSKVLRTAFVLTRISVADPDIADLIL
ncbi:MAG: pilus assembly protein N-terminal domain-containing protein, partial [Syntrophobacterales bacterium]|nr:pilus assembly protein N-terminal domain-containing protein [Syntrophobacterales bacterium]